MTSQDAIEITWTLLGLAGLLWNLGALWDAIADRRVVCGRDFHYDALSCEVTRGDVAREIDRVVIQALLLSAGALALLDDSPPPNRTPAGWLILGLIFATQAYLPIRAYRERRRRRRLLELAARLTKTPQDTARPGA